MAPADEKNKRARGARTVMVVVATALIFGIGGIALGRVWGVVCGRRIGKLEAMILHRRHHVERNFPVLRALDSGETQRVWYAAADLAQQLEVDVALLSVQCRHKQDFYGIDIPIDWELLKTASAYLEETKAGREP